jgi:hypothetical protein
MNPSNESDKKFEDLNSILKKFLKTSASTRSRYQSSRVKVGKKIEETNVNEMDKLTLSVKRLGKAGYILMLKSHGNVVGYLEMKTPYVRKNQVSAISITAKVIIIWEGVFLA